MINFYFRCGIFEDLTNDKNYLRDGISPPSPGEKEVLDNLKDQLFCNNGTGVYKILDIW